MEEFVDLWASERKELTEVTLPKFEVVCSDIAKKADAGDVLCREIIALHAIVKKKFDRIYCESFKRKLEQYLSRKGK